MSKEQEAKVIAKDVVEGIISTLYTQKESFINDMAESIYNLRNGNFCISIIGKTENFESIPPCEYNFSVEFKVKV